MYYIGSHWGMENDGYICSSTRMRNAYNRRILDFKRRVIKRIYSNRKALYDEEQKFLNLVKIKSRYYNMHYNISYVWTDENHNKKIGEKISESRKRGIAEGRINVKNGYEAAKQWMLNTPEKLEKAKKGLQKYIINNYELFCQTNRKSLEIRCKAAQSKESKEKRKATLKKINHQKGNKNSQFGTMWITNGIDNIKIKCDTVIPCGFIKGRKFL